MTDSKKIWYSILVLPLLIVGLVGCGANEAKKATSSNDAVTLNKEPYSEEQFLMGTYVRVKIFDDGKKDVLGKAFDRIKELDKKITVNQTGSEVDTINKEAGIKPVKVSDDVYELIEEAVFYSKDSNGGFDLTIGPITELWHIGFDDARKPEQHEIDDALALVNYNDVVLDEKEHTVYLKEKGMRLDLGAIAKGYITDEAIKVLEENGVTSGIVDLGGNIYVLGDSPRSKDGQWKIGVQDPNEARNTIVGSVTEQNQSLVTSGIYERNLEVDGKLYHHLFNSHTGYPFENDIAGITIVSDTSIAGDGLSTAVFSMGVKNGMSYVEGLDGVEAVFVTKDDDVYVSSGLKGNFQLKEDTPYTLKDIKTIK
ncbi:MAG: FAD:protein FMN transferase [Vagococcus sp.]